MGSVIKIGDDYYIEFFARGLRYRRNGGKHEEEARQLLGEIEGKIQKGETTIVALEINIDQFFTDYLIDVQKSVEVRSFDRYKSAALHFQEFTQNHFSGQAKLSAVTPSVIENYRAHLSKDHVSPNIINFTLLLLRSMLDHAINCGYLNDNPTLHAKLVSTAQKPAPRTLTHAQWETVLNGTSQHLKHVMIALRKTGMRSVELIKLIWANVDLKNNCLKIRNQIPIDGELLEILKRRYQEREGEQAHVFVNGGGHPWTEEGLTKDLDVAAGIIDLNETALVHAIRNTFAKDLLDKGVTLFGLHKFLGLSDIAKVMRFKQLAPTSSEER